MGSGCEAQESERAIQGAVARPPPFPPLALAVLTELRLPVAADPRAVADLATRLDWAAAA